MAKQVLAIDQGTTSTRAIIFDEKGKRVATHQLEHRQIYPNHSWVEHDPAEIWQNTLETCHKVIELAGSKPETIGITNQRETIVAWDKKSGETLHNAIVWQDKRTVEICQKLKQQHGKTITEKTGLPVDAYFSASKMQWLLENVDAVKAANENSTLALGTIDSFLLWKLTNGKTHATDITNASRTMLFNIHTCEWDKELLEIFGIPLDTLPEVHPNTADFGNSCIENIPVQAMVGDQQGASIGQACTAKGMLKSTYGTGCFAMLNTGTEPVTSQNGLLTTIAYQTTGGKVHYALEGSIFIAGAVVQWLRDRLELIHTAEETEALAKSANDDDGVYFVPAFAGLGAPYWNADVKAAISGMTLDTDKSVLVRATLDAVAFQTADLMQAMYADTGETIQSLRIDGGMLANHWLMQRLADILGISVECPEVIETTALGAAYLAGLQSGIYSSLEEVQQNWQPAHSFTANMSAEKRKAKLAGWQQAVQSLI
jgi:glycerol kinase